MDIFAICALALMTAVIGIFIKQYRPEFGALIVVACSVVILCFVAKYVGSLISTYTSIVKASGIKTDVFEVLIKSLGISYLTVFTAELCRDFGQNSIALKVESAGKICLIILATPMILSIIDVAQGLL